MLKVIQNTDSSEDYLYNAIRYIVNKMEAVRYDGYHVDPDNAYEQMMHVKRYFSKTSGNQLMHGVYNKEKTPTPVVSSPESCIDHCHGCGNICPNGAITYIGEDTGWTPPNGEKAQESGCGCGCGGGGCCE